MKIKRRKMIKSFYIKKITAALFLYILFVTLCGALVLISVAVPRSAFDTALIVSISIAVALFIGGSAVMLFYVIPVLKKKQAKIDFEKSDFSPYISDGESEVFEYEYLLYSYTFKSDLFDGNEEFIFNDENAITKYFEQFFSKRLIDENRTENNRYSYPLLVGNCSDEKGVKYHVKKKLDGDNIVVDINEIHRAEFAMDGIHIGDKIYSYNETQARVIAHFDKSTNFIVSVRILMLLGKDDMLSIKLSSRIAAVILRFGIPIVNRNIFDYILKDPEHAYEQTAMQSDLEK